MEQLRAQRSTNQNSSGLRPVSKDLEARRTRVFWYLAVESGLWFFVEGPILAMVLGLSFIPELVLIVLPAAGLGAIGAYVRRPEKFRASLVRRSDSVKTK